MKKKHPLAPRVSLEQFRKDLRPLKEDLFQAYLERCNPFYAAEWADNIEQDERCQSNAEKFPLVRELMTELVAYLREHAQRGPLEDPVRLIRRKLTPNPRIQELADQLRISGEEIGRMIPITFEG